MANHPSALRRVRQTRRRTTRNRTSASRLRTAMKKLQRAITAGDKTAADQLLRPTISAIDKAIQKGAIHHNAADRYKSQLTSAYNRIAAKTA